MADHGTTLSKLIKGRKVSSGTTESRVNQFKIDVKRGFRSALSSMFGEDTKKSDAPKAAAKPQTKAAPATAAPAKTASKSAPATETRTSGRGGGPGRENQNPEGNYDQKRITTVKTTPEAAKSAAAKETQTDRNNKASAARRKARRKSSDAKYNELPGGKFNFAGAVSRQLTGR